MAEQYIIAHIVYFKTKRTVIENISYIISKLLIFIIYTPHTHTHTHIYIYIYIYIYAHTHTHTLL